MRSARGTGRRILNDPLSLRDAMDRLLEESVVRPGTSFLSALDPDTIPVDMYETDTEIVVQAPVPGVKTDDIEISVTGDTLKIQGEVKREEKTEKVDYVYQERQYGTFSRSLKLPSPVVAEKANAEVKDGVLTLNLPKSEEVRPKSIKVSAETKQAKGSS